MRDLNLIPYEIKDKKLKAEKNRKYVSYGILVLCLIFIIAYFPLMYSKGLEKKAAGLKDQVDSKSSIINNYNSINNKIKEINIPIGLANSTEADRVLVHDRIVKLSNTFPSGIVLISLSYQPDGILITGKSSDYNSPYELAANLELTKEFNTAKIGSINYDKDSKVYNFSITIPQKGVANNEKSQ